MIRFGSAEVMTFNLACRSHRTCGLVRTIGNPDEIRP
jgi:hypothetical protein